MALIAPVVGRVAGCRCRLAAPQPAKKRGIGLWVGAAAALLVMLAGGTYALIGGKGETPQMAAPRGPSAVEKAAQDAQMAAEAQRLKDQEELAKLRAEAAAREKAEQEAAQRRQIEEETRRKVETEMADKQRQQDEARQKAASEAAAARRTEDDEKKAAETAENGLRLTTLDRQHVQVALAALGFGNAGTDGTFGRAHARDDRGLAEGAQRSADRLPDRRAEPGAAARGGAGGLALRRGAEEARRGEEEGGRGEGQGRGCQPGSAAAAASRRGAAAAPAPNSAAAATPKSGPDGTWKGTLQCTPSRNGGEIPFPSADQCVGRHAAPGCVPAPGPAPAASSRSASGSTDETSRSRASSCRAISRACSRPRPCAPSSTALPPSPAAGPEHNGGGRSCQIILTRP